VPYAETISDGKVVEALVLIMSLVPQAAAGTTPDATILTLTFGDAGTAGTYIGKA
jgi:hypothetical protein